MARTKEHQRKRRRTNSNGDTTTSIAGQPSTFTSTSPSPTPSQSNITQPQNPPSTEHDFTHSQIEDTSSSDSDTNNHDDGKPDDDDTSSSGSSDTDSEIHPLTQPAVPDPTIHNRLTSFFAALAERRANTGSDLDIEGNQVIEEDSSDSGYDDDDGEGGGKQYVQLDLALGVLEEKRGEEGDGMGEVKVPKGNEGEASSGEDEDGSECNGDGESKGDDAIDGVLRNLQTVMEGRSGRKTLKPTTRTKAKPEKRKVEEVN